MKRTITITLITAMLAGFASLTTGCASSKGTYFQRTRKSGAHVQRDRIYNPADSRFAVVDED